MYMITFKYQLCIVIIIIIDCNSLILLMMMMMIPILNDTFDITDRVLCVEYRVILK